MTTTYPLHDTLTLGDSPFPADADVVIAGAASWAAQPRITWVCAA
ncbi:hypothetical protein CSX04_06343 [Burkholderia cepacia]|nr:hypothetical protein CSX04_06343 [Burkholderia cepacia]